MQKKLEINSFNHSLFKKEDKLLLAISGGADSVVLAHLLSEGKYNFCLAHCNFNLRGKDSEKDEKFCRNLAKKLNVKFYSKQFDVAKHKRDHKVSTQMAARELRYDWFSELLKKEKLNYILTAHNANDVIETFFLNIVRGTGINGLKGIQQVNEKVIRPILHVKKDEILRYAKKNKIKFRTDKSNLEDKYERNFIRLKVIPLLKKLNPSIEKTILKNISRFAEENLILNTHFLEIKKRLVSEKDNVIYIDKNGLKDELGLLSLINYLINPFEFNNAQSEEIRDNIVLNRSSGKKWKSKNYDLVVDREFISIKKSELIEPSIIIRSLKELNSINIWKVKSIAKFSIPKKNELIVDEKNLVFPLIIRHKKTGDKFKPFGMKGYKLVSDFLKDEKLSTFEREKIQLFVNGNNQIIWIIGQRSDERYRVNAVKNKFLKLSLIE